MDRHNYKKCDFNTLIFYVQNSDIKATAEFIKRIQKDIYTFFCHLCPPTDSISDLTQETLIKIIKNIKSLKNINQFKNWRNRIAINVFYDSIRKSKKIKNLIEIDSEKFNLIEDTKRKPLENCQCKELECKIKTCIINLPLNSRIAIVLRELEGLSYDEIAKLTNTNLGTVKSRISRAREKLQVELASYL